MKFMVIETFKPGLKDEVYRRFEGQGRMLPEGLIYLDSWLSTDGVRCFQLMETDDDRLFAGWTAKWDDLVEFEIVPVNDSPTEDSSA